MNALTALDNHEVWHIAGWTMIHYLWMGTLIGIFALALRLLLRRAAANVRYAAALACLFVLAALPIGIASWLVSYSPPLKGTLPGGISKPVATIELQLPAAPSGPDVIDLRNQQEPLVAAEADAEAVPTNAPQLEPSPGPSLKGRGIKLAALDALVPYMPWLWIVGTPITFTLLAAGVVGTKRLRRA
jgi:hypothetical protein